MDQNASGVKTWQWIVTVIVIIILIILGYNLFKGNSEVPVVTEEPTEETPIKSTTETNRVVVSDQFPGNIVYVLSAQFSQPGFVVIHKDKAGMPGDVIGYQYFEKGINPGKISLTSPTVDGGTYYAVLYTDDGDKKFDITKDLPIKDSKGSTIMKVFKVSTSVTEVKG